MSDKPKRKRSEGKVYRPTLLRRAAGVVGFILLPLHYLIWMIIFLGFEDVINSFENLLLFLLFCLTVASLQLWLIFETTFRISLSISSEGGEYHFLGHHIYFRWEDVKCVEYMWWGKKRDWYLVLHKTALVDKACWSPRVGLIYKSLETHVPLGEFIPITAVKLFSVDFWGTSLGSNIRQYAPDLYTPYWLKQMEKSKH
jgi:hypothetical protein